MPRSGRGNKRSILTALSWIDVFLSDRILNHLRVKGFNEVGGAITEVVEGRSTGFDATTNQPTAIIVLHMHGPLRW